MTKHEFLTELRKRIAGLPDSDIQKSLDYYSEMIDDRMDDGLSEEEAVGALDSMDEIVKDILSTASLPRLVKQHVASKPPLTTGEIVLFILTAPLWVPIAFAGICVVFSMFVILWTIVIVLYTVSFCMVIGTISALFGTLIYLLGNQKIWALLLFGISLVCAGMVILLFRFSNLTAKGATEACKKLLFTAKSWFVGKKAAS